MSGGAMPVFGDAYMADTRHLTLEEHGAYYLLMLIAWRSPNCALPNDDKRLAQMLGVTGKKWASLKTVIMAFWTLTEQGWQQKRLTKERRYVEEKSRKNRDAAESRWDAKPLKTNNVGNANAYPNAHANADANGYAPPPPPPPLKEKEQPKGCSKKIAKLLPSDWQPEPFNDNTVCGDIVRAWGGERLPHEVEAFKAHHQSRANAMIDWQKAWVTWVLNSARFEKERRNGNASGEGKSAAAFRIVGGSDDRPF